MQAGEQGLLAVAHGQRPLLLWRWQGHGSALQFQPEAAAEVGAGDQFKAPQGAVHEAAGAAPLHRRVAEQGPGFEGLADRQLCSPLLPVQQLGEAPLPDLRKGFRIKLEAVSSELGQHLLQIAPELAGEQELVVQGWAPVTQLAGAMGGLQQMHGQGAPEQGDGVGPAGLRQGLQGPKFQQPLAACGPGRVPELVEADLAAVGVAAAVGVQVAQGFADRHPLVPRG